MIQFLGGCNSIESPIKSPESFVEFIGSEYCPACTNLSELRINNPEFDVFIFGIESKQYGNTYFVNIDRDRDIIKLRSVRDRNESIILFDPNNLATKGHETGSNYIQPRCSDGINRFELAAAFIYEHGADRNNFDQFYLSGKCSMSEESRILYRYEKK